MNSVANQETVDPRIVKFDTGMVTEASLLELSPGEWPESFVTSDRHTFVFKKVNRDYEGDIECVIYCDLETGAELTVLND